MEKTILKTKTSTILTILVLITTALLVALPATNAQLTKKTYPYIGTMPNPVGVNQETLIHLGISDVTVWPQPGWTGLTVTVTRPDGNTETLGPFTTDTTGGTGTVYTPTMVGTYYFQTNFPEQVLQYDRAGRTFPAGSIMQAGTSEKLELTVTQEPRTYYPDEPLPTEYWTRPVNTQLRAWGQISGNWLTTPPNRYAPYNDAPEAPHILWAQPLAEGGVAGGDLGPQGFETGDAYEGKFSGSVIINGVLYFNRHISQSSMPAFDSTLVEQEVVAVDLKNGEELWCKVLGDNERLAFGQVMYWQTMNLYGAYAYLWTTVGRTWNAYDPLTGRWEYSIENAPSGTRNYGPNGEILIYTVNTANGWMTQWNSTTVVYKTYFDYYLSRPADAPNAKYYSERWRPFGIKFDASVGYDWNVSIPNLPGSSNAYNPRDRIIGTSISRVRPNEEPIVTWGLSLKQGQQGLLLFNETYQPPAGHLELNFGSANFEDKVFTVRCKEIRGFIGFSTETGKYLWGPTEPRPYMDLFMGGPSGESGILAYGKLFAGTVGGVLQCIDVTTGNILWTYENTQSYTELVWGGENWPIEFAFVSDGKVYLLHSEHSGNSPLPRGAPFVCLNATTGDIIFKVEGAFRATTWGGDPMIADSAMVMFNTYDNRIYAIGKGPSATTITASPKVPAKGSSVLIEGRITDVSAGTKDTILTERFPDGVPAVSDESMGDWMKYVYMQFGRPADAKGVPVKIEIVDPNNQYSWIGTATTDSDGNYAYSFIPQTEGQYMIIATFDGSASYYGSHSITYLKVDPAVSPSGPITPETPAPLISTEAAIIGAVSIAAVLGLASFAIIRRRK
jgi:hypothetical protein